MAAERSVLTVIGIRKAKSRKSDAVWTTYHCKKGFSDYELENSDEIHGAAVEIVTTSEDFPIQVGDEVLFFYGKAIGDYQPVVDFKMIRQANSAKVPDKPPVK
ncbi:MAG: hypothetical protein K2K19_02735 [Acetatifactor sp.]|nr:hypothetical protein [Acetatifactor sp.]